MNHIDDDTIMTYADNFSTIMKEELTSNKYLIKDTIDFLAIILINTIYILYLVLNKMN